MASRKFKIIGLSYCLLLFVFARTLYGQTDTRINIGERFVIQSEVLQENREVIIGLPQSYDSGSKEYPILVLLDGDYHFVSNYGVIEYLSKRFRIPEMIIVAIPSTNRVRDLTISNTKVNFNGEVDESLEASGGGMNYLSFIVSEVLPYMKEKYRTNGYSTLVGHSWGGLLSSFSFLNGTSAFNSFIAIDPSYWWDQQFIIKALDSVKLDVLVDKRIFISASSIEIERNNNPSELHRNSIDLFYSKLKNSKFNNKSCFLKYLEDEDHASVPFPSLYYGLRFIFQDFVLDAVNEKSLDQIKEHFKKYSQRYGKTFLPPEDLIRNVGQYKLYAENDMEEAFLFFQYNAFKHPGSWKALSGLAEVYLKLKKPDKAIEYFEKAVELNSNYEYGKRKLEELKSK